jgi:cytochrome c oxidase subunit 2
MNMFLESVSTYAGKIDGLFWLIAVLVGFWFFVAQGVLFWFLWKFRSSAVEKSQYITGEEKHEKKWIHLPHNLIILCDVAIVVGAVWVWYVVKQDLPDRPDRETIGVIARQWAWNFVHPGPDKKLGTEDDVTTSNELRIKVNTLYHFKLESLDVLNNFSIPVFRLKQDAVPGRVYTGWFEATKTGTYDIQCAEMCGIGHGIMGAKLFIQTAEEHDAWLKEMAAKKVALSGG